VPRYRLHVDAGLAALSAVLLALTLVVPDWIEVVFGLEPDGGTGELEWLIAGALALGTVGFGLAARRDWRRARA
jgi:hypothetical protein